MGFWSDLGNSMVNMGQDMAGQSSAPSVPMQDSAATQTRSAANPLAPPASADNTSGYNTTGLTANAIPDNSGLPTVNDFGGAQSSSAPQDSLIAGNNGMPTVSSAPSQSGGTRSTLQNYFAKGGGWDKDSAAFVNNLAKMMRMLPQPGQAMAMTHPASAPGIPNKQGDVGQLAAAMSNPALTSTIGFK